MNFQPYFLSDSAVSIVAYKEAIDTAKNAISQLCEQSTQPFSGINSDQLIAAIENLDPCPESGILLRNSLNTINDIILNNSVLVHHPLCIAHLHCPPLIPALAAEVLISATNQSMDSWDQSPAATLLEEHLIKWLCQVFGYGKSGDGVFTSGGTQSNFMGLLLARDSFADQHLNWSIQTQGLPPEFTRFRILTSEVSHFTVTQSASLLGLGANAVVSIPTDDNFCLDINRLEAKIAELKADNLLPIAIIGTVGTTDFGSIDPITKLAEIARKNDIWLHLDAAYGGGLILSKKHKHLLNQIWLADSITVDFHKMFYQPISCGAFLIKKAENFRFIKLHADYLNPETNQEIGIPDLVTKSIQTTKRFDALKLFISLQTLGKSTFGEIIDTTINIARETAEIIDNYPQLKLATKPTINTVVFRYLPKKDNLENANYINNKIRYQLIQSGIVVLAQTKVKDFTHLKFTLLNPQTQITDIKKILTQICVMGEEIEQQSKHSSSELSSETYAYTK